jgi:hypothetical protein
MHYQRDEPVFHLPLFIDLVLMLEKEGMFFLLKCPEVMMISVEFS